MDTRPNELPDAPEHAGAAPDDGGGDRRHRRRQHERLEEEPRRARVGLLELLFARLPDFDAVRRGPAALGRGRRQAQRAPVRTRRSLLEKTLETRDGGGRPGEPLTIRATTTRSASHVASERQKPYDEENFSMPVRIAVPIGKLGLVPSGDHYQGDVLRLRRRAGRAEKQSDLSSSARSVDVPGKDLQKAQAQGLVLRLRHDRGPGSPADRFRRARRDTGTTSFYQKNMFVSLLPKAAAKDEKPKS